MRSRRRTRMRTVWRVIAALARRRLRLRRLHLPDASRRARPAHAESLDDGVHRAADAPGGRQGRAAAPRAALGHLLAHLAEPDARGASSTEDGAFWEHDGVDFQQLKESMEVNLERMEFARGASTITQQLAKNLYLSPSKNPIRKVARAAHRAPARSGAVEAAHPRAVPERHRVGRRHLRRRGGGAHLLRQVRARSSGRRSRRCSPARSSTRGCSIPASPTARLRRRQEMILRRMGAVTPPPVVAEPSSPADAPPEPARDSRPVAAGRARQPCCRAKSCRRRSLRALAAARRESPRVASAANELQRVTRP